MERIAACDMRNRSQIEFCIDAFAEETGYIPADARSVRNPGELSPQLAQLVGSLTASTGWRAWFEGQRGWFVQGRLADCSDSQLDQPTVYLIFRDHDAVAVTAGVWRRSAPSRWELLQFFNCHAVADGRH
jgi:hypothetical protein